MTERTPSGALTVEEIRRLYLPVADRPREGMNLPCMCRVCLPPSPELEQ